MNAAASESAADSAEVIVFFDGVCNLCNGAVQFILKREKQQQLKFAALQSQAFSRLARPLMTTVPDSIVFFTAGKFATESEAVLQISRYLKQPWRALGYLGSMFPSWLRNPLYRFIARNRYRWFGKKESCYLPTPALRRRFLD